MYVGLDLGQVHDYTALAAVQHDMVHLRLADSIGIDFHKTGYTPYISSLVLVRDAGEFDLIARGHEVMPYLYQSGEHHPGSEPCRRRACCRSRPNSARHRPFTSAPDKPPSFPTIVAISWTRPKPVRTSGHRSAVPSNPLRSSRCNLVSSAGAPFFPPPDPGCRRRR